MASYNLKNIRKLLTEGFTNQELRRFCQDEQAFRPVYEQLTQYSSTVEIVDLILDHAQRKLQHEAILDWAREHNPDRYKRHQPYSISKKPPNIDKTSVQIPILGTISAGEPIQVPEGAFNGDEFIELSRSSIPQVKNVYALKVKGDSMIDAFINDGDVVIMLRTETANSRDMVAAWLVDQQETTLKRIYRENGQIRLQPENKAYPPLYYDPDKIIVQGRVITVIRQY